MIFFYKQNIGNRNLLNVERQTILPRFKMGGASVDCRCCCNGVGVDSASTAAVSPCSKLQALSGLAVGGK